MEGVIKAAIIVAGHKCAAVLKPNYAMPEVAWEVPAIQGRESMRGMKNAGAAFQSGPSTADAPCRAHGNGVQYQQLPVQALQEGDLFRVEGEAEAEAEAICISMSRLLAEIWQGDHACQGSQAPGPKVKGMYPANSYWERQLEVACLQIRPDDNVNNAAHNNRFMSG